MPRRIILIDDDPDDIEIMLDVLRTVDREFNLTAFSDPGDAIEVLRTISPPPAPDYVILDVFMHKMNGLDCMQKLRQIEALKHATFLVHSTSTLDRDVMRKFKEAGATVFQKPTSFRGFEALFKEFLK